MLTIHIPESEMYDENAERFITFKGATIVLEHSLLSLSKWEEKWHIPFIDNKTLTEEQILDYIRCMTINQVDNKAYAFLSVDNIKDIKNYIEDKHTATWFSDKKSAKGMYSQNGTAITAELIYYWMVTCNIPFSCEKWHINKLLTLIRICSEMNNPDKKKMSKNDTLRNNSELNALRRAQFKSRG